MEKLITFKNDQFGNIRTIEKNSKIYFCGKDVATALGYKVPKDAISAHCKGAVKYRYPTTSGVQSMSFIPEGDLYRLITHSKLPTAEKFEQWVFDEVLPEIRLTGKYDLSREDDTVSPLNLPDSKDYLTAARLVAHCPKERLSIVLDFLEKGGFDVSKATPMSVGISTADISMRIKETMERLGVSCHRLSEISGIPDESLRCYYNGTRFPKPERYKEIVMTLNML
ncbi:MAG: Bro-N domain-containing protein [Clostridiaceae bacterium]|nr:Bro-N domain-containing protein [Clostridiaceae bacterium]